MLRLETSIVLLGLFIAICATPAQAERELTSDRPDATESPFTVEPGRFQPEASAVQYLHDRHNAAYTDERLSERTFAPLNLRIGFGKSSEVQVMVDPHRRLEIKDGNEEVLEHHKGFGDITLRAKWNFWGNDGGATALGLMPFVKFPTAKSGLGNDSVEGGVILPFAMELRAGWGFGAMTEVDIVRNEADTGYEALWVNTATVSHDIVGGLGGFLELASEVGAGKPTLAFDSGLTFAVNDDLQLDIGVNIGLTRAADDVVVFAGIVKRY